MKWCDYSWSVPGHLILWSLWIWVTDFDSAQKKSRPRRGCFSTIGNFVHCLVLFSQVSRAWGRVHPPQIYSLISDVCRLGVTNSWHGSCDNDFIAIHRVMHPYIFVCRKQNTAKNSGSIYSPCCEKNWNRTVRQKSFVWGYWQLSWSQNIPIMKILHIQVIVRFLLRSALKSFIWFRR